MFETDAAWKLHLARTQQLRARPFCRWRSHYSHQMVCKCRLRLLHVFFPLPDVPTFILRFCLVLIALLTKWRGTRCRHRLHNTYVRLCSSENLECWHDGVRAVSQLELARRRPWSFDCACSTKNIAPVPAQRMISNNRAGPLNFPLGRRHNLGPENN
jgi:hypothetical protein